MTDHDRDPGLSPGDEGNDPHEPTAGPANTPPFEASEQPAEREEGRPPSHREQLGEPHPGEEEGMEAIAPASYPGGGETASRAREEMDDMRETASDTFEAAADRVREGAREWAEEGGIRGTASRWADRASDVRDDAVDYLHASGVDDLRALVEKQVRERPLQSLLLAAATGWLVGKILR